MAFSACPSYFRDDRKYHPLGNGFYTCKMYERYYLLRKFNNGSGMELLHRDTFPSMEAVAKRANEFHLFFGHSKFIIPNVEEPIALPDLVPIEPINNRNTFVPRQGYKRSNGTWIKNTSLRAA